LLCLFFIAGSLQEKEKKLELLPTLSLPPSPLLSSGPAPPRQPGPDRGGDRRQPGGDVSGLRARPSLSETPKRGSQPLQLPPRVPPRPRRGPALARVEARRAARQARGGAAQGMEGMGGGKAHLRKGLGALCARAGLGGARPGRGGRRRGPRLLLAHALGPRRLQRRLAFGAPLFWRLSPPAHVPSVPEAGARQAGRPFAAAGGEGPRPPPAGAGGGAAAGRQRRRERQLPGPVPRPAARGPPCLRRPQPQHAVPRGRDGGPRAPRRGPLGRRCGREVREAKDGPDGAALAVDDGALPVFEVRLRLRPRGARSSPGEPCPSSQERSQTHGAPGLARGAASVARVLLLRRRGRRPFVLRLRREPDLPPRRLGRRPATPGGLERGADGVSVDRRRDDAAEGRGVDSPPGEARGGEKREERERERE